MRSTGASARSGSMAVGGTTCEHRGNSSPCTTPRGWDRIAAVQARRRATRRALRTATSLIWPTGTSLRRVRGRAIRSSGIGAPGLPPPTGSRSTRSSTGRLTVRAADQAEHDAALEHLSGLQRAVGWPVVCGQERLPAASVAASLSAPPSTSALPRRRTGCRRTASASAGRRASGSWSPCPATAPRSASPRPGPTPALGPPPAA